MDNLIADRIKDEFDFINNVLIYSTTHNIVITLNADHHEFIAQKLINPNLLKDIDNVSLKIANNFIRLCKKQYTNKECIIKISLTDKTPLD